MFFKIVITAIAVYAYLTLGEMLMLKFCNFLRKIFNPRGI